MVRVDYESEARNGNSLVRSENGVLKTHSNRFKKLDSNFFIDACWLKIVFGEGGTSSIFELFKQRCLPVANPTLELKAALKSGEALLAGSFYKYVMESSQNQLKAAVRLLQSLSSDEAPDAFVQGTPFMVECWTQSVLFFKRAAETTESASTDAKSEEPEVQPCADRGVAALKAHWECLEAQRDEEVNLIEFVPLTTFGPWLDADTRKAIRNKKSRIENKVTTSATAKAKAKPQPANELKKRKAASSSDADAVAAARALLGRRKKA
eukprot:2375513-Amphidinium_carterae.1